MSAEEELERLRAMRAELEAESRSLVEKQQNLEDSVLVLKENVLMEVIKKEKAVIEDLRKRNEATKGAIAQLEAKKTELETKLGQMKQNPEAELETEKGKKSPKQPKKAEEAPEHNEDTEDNGVTITAIDDEMFETQEKQQEKKKRKFF
jgi:hypothetical protein